MNSNYDKFVSFWSFEGMQSKMSWEQNITFFWKKKKNYLIWQKRFKKQSLR